MNDLTDDVADDAIFKVLRAAERDGKSRWDEELETVDDWNVFGGPSDRYLGYGN